MHQRINWQRLARHLLRQGGFNTKTLGQAVGLSQPTISRLSSGRTATLGPDAAISMIELAGGIVKLPELPEDDAGAAPTESSTEAV